MSSNRDVISRAGLRGQRRLGAMAVLLVAALLSTVLVFSGPAAAETGAEASTAVEAGATPRFVSPTPQEAIRASRFGARDLFSEAQNVEVEMDHNGVDVASGWMFVGTEPLGSDIDAVHMGTGTRVVVPRIDLDGEVHLTYVYRPAGEGWHRITQQVTFADSPLLDVGPVVLPGPNPMRTRSVTISGVPAGIESSWLVLEPTSWGTATVRHLGTQPSQTVAVPGADAFWDARYYYKLDGRWYYYGTIQVYE